MKKIKLPDGSDGRVNTYKKNGNKIIVEMPETEIDMLDLDRLIATHAANIIATKNSLAIMEAELKEMKAVKE